VPLATHPPVSRNLDISNCKILTQFHTFLDFQEISNELHLTFKYPPSKHPSNGPFQFFIFYYFFYQNMLWSCLW